MATMNPRRSLLGSLAVVLLLAPAPAHADDAIAELARETPIAAYGGALAWSDYDAATERYRLLIRQGDATAPARMPTAKRPFDISLGPDSNGRVVALYTRCRAAARGRSPERACDVYRYDLRARRERKLSSVSSPSLDEAWPAQWHDRIAFARRARTHVIDGFNHRPDPRGRGPILECDIPYVKTLSSRAPSRRLDRSQCGSTAGIAIRRDTIALVTDINQGGAGSESQVRTMRARGGAATILARARGGEDGYSPFTSPSLSASAVWLTRSGSRADIEQGFLRIDLRSRRLTTIPADVTPLARRRFGDSIARDERGRFWYVQGPQPDFNFESSCDRELDPCRLVRASASPFSTTPRKLLPALNIDGAGEQQIKPFAADPPVLTGELSRAILRRGNLVGREPVPGIGLDLLRTRSIDKPGPFTATGLTTTTDQAGRWAFRLNQPPPDVLLVVAPRLRIASSIVPVEGCLGPACAGAASDSSTRRGSR